MRTLRLVPALILLVAANGLAQSTANLSGTVTSDEGNALAEVSMTLTGPGGSQMRKSNDSGQFRFLGIPPGDYQLSAKLDGFADVAVPGPVRIKAGQNKVDIRMVPALQLRNE